jgi:hypothetical protein
MAKKSVVQMDMKPVGLTVAWKALLLACTADERTVELSVCFSVEKLVALKETIVAALSDFEKEFDLVEE